ncbi:phage tail protein [Arthrobacter sp. Sa2BUA2]|uniref:Phage tail protein n=1 Tax=Arthrobacter pullicola TaxID=2762224 RepID=A0ABR8YED2_9MICC|nr:tail fiber protein [Arthrobacter pullicola]MBD8042565.1 phage tail protein [Arthrobacter pullicola]
MTDAYLGEIRMVGFNFAPAGWAHCNGQILPILQNTALFSLLGTMYGGDGMNTFALPNLQGTFPLHMGQAPSGSQYLQAQRGGQEAVVLRSQEMPAHSHPQHGSPEQVSDRPTGKVPSRGGSFGSISSGADMAPTGIAGGNQPHNNMPPYLAINFIIALNGIFPPRS